MTAQTPHLLGTASRAVPRRPGRPAAPRRRSVAPRRSRAAPCGPRPQQPLQCKVHLSEARCSGSACSMQPASSTATSRLPSLQSGRAVLLSFSDSKNLTSGTSDARSCSADICRPRTASRRARGDVHPPCSSGGASDASGSRPPASPLPCCLSLPHCSAGAALCALPLPSGLRAAARALCWWGTPSPPSPCSAPAVLPCFAKLYTAYKSGPQSDMCHICCPQLHRRARV
jgi:hypothetical protein